MSSEKAPEKTATKTIEIKAPTSAVSENSGQHNVNMADKTDPTVKNNRTDEQKKQHHTQVLLHAKEMLEKTKVDDGDLEFTATSIMKLSPEMKEALSTTAPGDDTRAISIPKSNLTEDQAKQIKDKVKAHYQQKALLVEAEINKILATFKSNNPVLNQRIDMIKKILAKHAGRE